MTQECCYLVKPLPPFCTWMGPSRMFITRFRLCQAKSIQKRRWNLSGMSRLVANACEQGFPSGDHYVVVAS
jgi:hypothetical protein